MRHNKGVTMNRSERLPVALYLIAVIALMLLPFAANAQGVACYQWETARKALEEKYHETIVGSGIINDKTVVIVFASPDGETFTLLSVGADGLACKILDGGGWNFDTPKVGEPS